MLTFEAAGTTIVLVAFLFMECKMVDSILGMFATGVASVLLAYTGKEFGWSKGTIFFLVANVILFLLNFLVVVGVIQ